VDVVALTGEAVVGAVVERERLIAGVGVDDQVDAVPAVNVVGAAPPSRPPPRTASSSPAPPSRWSAPSAPLSRSPPSPPFSVSLPSPPFSESSPSPPFCVVAPVTSTSVVWSLPSPRLIVTLPRRPPDAQMRSSGVDESGAQSSVADVMLSASSWNRTLFGAVWVTVRTLSTPAVAVNTGASADPPTVAAMALDAPPHSAPTAARTTNAPRLASCPRAFSSIVLILRTALHRSVRRGP
jgi:hypothetical protein